MTDSPNRNWQAPLWAAAAALLAAGALDGCRSARPAASKPGALQWRRNILAGQRASAADVAVVPLPAGTGGNVLARDQLQRFARGVWLARSVRRGDWVRPADLAPSAAARAVPASATTAPDWRKLPSGDPRTIEAEGKYPRYITTTMTAERLEGETRPAEDTRPVRPADLATRPLTGTGLRVLGKDVPGAVVPPGAQRLYGFRQSTPDGQSDNLAYLAGMTPAAAEAFYKTKLPPAGYKLLGRGPTMRGKGGLALVFARDVKQHYFVHLYPADKDGKKVKIVLMIARPGGGR